MAKLVALSMDFAGAIFPARAHLKSLTEAEEEASPRTNRNQHETCFDSPGSLASRCGCSPPASFPLSWPVVAGDRSARINARRAELIFISVLQLQVGLPLPFLRLVYVLSTLFPWRLSLSGSWRGDAPAGKLLMVRQRLVLRVRSSTLDRSVIGSPSPSHHSSRIRISCAAYMDMGLQLLDKIIYGQHNIKSK